MTELPEELIKALVYLSEEDREAALRTYLEASPEDREGMLAFLVSRNLEHVRQLHLENEDGTPTASDLEEWLL